MAQTCTFKFFSQPDKQCVHAPALDSDVCIWHDAAINKADEYVELRLKTAIKESHGDLEGFFLRKSDLRKVPLKEVNLRDADLRETAMDSVDAGGSDCRGADLRRTSAADTSFQNANCMMANFLGANLRGANFSGANLRIVNFSQADLIGVNFAGADVRNADFTDAAVDQTTNFQGAVGLDGAFATTYGVSVDAGATSSWTSQVEKPPSDDSEVEIFSDAFTADSEPESFTDMHVAAGVPAPPTEDPAIAVEPATHAVGEAPAVPDISAYVGELMPEAPPVAPETMADTAAIEADLPPETATIAGAPDELPTELPPLETEEDNAPSTKSFEPGELNVAGSTMPKKAAIALSLGGLVIGVVLGWAILGSSGEGGSGSSGELKSLRAGKEKLESQLAASEKGLTDAVASKESLEQEVVGLKDDLAKESGALQALQLKYNKFKHQAQRTSDLTENKLLADLQQQLQDAAVHKVDMINGFKAEKATLQKQNVALTEELDKANSQYQEAIEQLKDYEKKLAQEKKLREKTQVSLSRHSDPFLKTHPTFNPIDWSRLQLIEGPEYNVGIKLIKGVLVNCEILILPREIKVAPKFQLKVYDATGKLLKTHLVDPGLTLRQGEMDYQTSGWRITNGEPRYFEIKF